MTDDDFDLKHAMFQVSDGVLGAAVLIVIGVFGGNWLDGKLHTAPALLITLSLLGGALGLWRLVGKAMKIANVSSSATTGATNKTPTVSAEKPAAGSADGGTRQRNPYEDYDS